jgi:nucleotide-binding universal stress UspA family protein
MEVGGEELYTCKPVKGRNTLMRFAHILAPTDFSTPANQALQYAFEEATQHQARLTLLHVVQHRPATEVYYLKGTPQQPDYVGELSGRLPSLPPPPLETLRRDYHAEALTQLRHLVPASFTEFWDVQVTAGDPAEAIVRMATENEADLIVMATHGHAGLQHVLLGSVAEKVVRHAPCPVLTIRYKKAVA